MRLAAPTMTDALDLDDVQGLIARGYPDLKAASYVLLRVDDPPGARAWLTSLQVTAAPARPSDFALNIAFTATGLRALGLPEVTLSQFSNEFTAGMTTSHRRRMFGDVDASAPERWTWGGPATPAPDLLLLLFARDVETLNAGYANLDLHGVSELRRLDAFVDLDGKERSEERRVG